MWSHGGELSLSVMALVVVFVFVSASRLRVWERRRASACEGLVCPCAATARKQAFELLGLGA